MLQTWRLMPSPAASVAIRILNGPPRGTAGLGSGGGTRTYPTSRPLLEDLRAERDAWRDQAPAGRPAQVGARAQFVVVAMAALDGVITSVVKRQ